MSLVSGLSIFTSPSNENRYFHWPMYIYYRALKRVLSVHFSRYFSSSCIWPPIKPSRISRRVGRYSKSWSNMYRINLRIEYDIWDALNLRQFRLSHSRFVWYIKGFFSTSGWMWPPTVDSCLWAESGLYRSIVFDLMISYFLTSPLSPLTAMVSNLKLTLPIGISTVEYWSLCAVVKVKKASSKSMHSVQSKDIHWPSWFLYCHGWFKS